MLTPPHTVAPLLTATGCRCWGSSTTKLGTGASHSGSDYQESSQFPNTFCRPSQLVATWSPLAPEGFRMAQKKIYKRHYEPFKTFLVSLVDMPVSQ